MIQGFFLWQQKDPFTKLRTNPVKDHTCRIKNLIQCLASPARRCAIISRSSAKKIDSPLGVRGYLLPCGRLHRHLRTRYFTSVAVLEFEEKKPKQQESVLAKPEGTISTRVI